MDASQLQQPHDTPAQAPYVVSASGHSAHPDQIIASCRALQEHLQKLQDDAHATIAKWEGDIRARELAEKRRVAPGWLDVDSSERMLVPQRPGGAFGGAEASSGMVPRAPGAGVERMELDGRAQRGDQGEELDRAFGGLGIR